jgi:hypothetical protein
MKAARDFLTPERLAEIRAAAESYCFQDVKFGPITMRELTALIEALRTAMDALRGAEYCGRNHGACDCDQALAARSRLGMIPAERQAEDETPATVQESGTVAQATCTFEGHHDCTHPAIPGGDRCEKHPKPGNGEEGVGPV